MPYTAPTVADFHTRFDPAFPTVTDAQIQLALDRGGRMVDDTWTEGDYQEGYLLFAAHWLSVQGIGAASAGVANLGGFSEIRSGQLTLKRSSGAEIGGWDGSQLGSTMYGRMYQDMVRLNAPRTAVAAGPAMPEPSGYAKDWPGPFPWPNW